ncbi:hypothetical protein J7I93_16105 [Bacillus sp. ISL-47]|uniref:hypothetical protein n=1 Tax=Bacillus sp. ISL-47 TaxID=2819130 RepID=UPI001BE6A9C7|nr:hypothetical protein [Bacillus sp. ISL-47]MBT2689711.1 hypothetical protein [Bacillus sp. ISL-47]MBT2709998.1 hypothetical protein [Pseudomonas sp. ISL-84]
MNKTEMLTLFVLIERVYPGFRIKNDIVQYYFSQCQDMDFDEAMGCIKEHIRKSPYPPSISHIAAKSLRNHLAATGFETYSWHEEYVLAYDIS